MEQVLHWLLPAVGGALAAHAVPWPAKALWQWIRGGADARAQSEAVQAKREQSEIQRLAVQLGDAFDLIDLLRKALDKHMIRWGSVVSACELLIALAGMVERPTPAMVAMRDRAKRLLEDARSQMHSINHGGNE